MRKLYSLLCLLLCVQLTYAAAPTTPATNISFSSIDGGSLKINFTVGNGAKRIIIARAGAAVTAVPQNGTDYLHSNVFGNGQEIATGQFIVHDGTGNSADISGLQPATTYFFTIYEYNGTDAATEYLLTGTAASIATLSAPTTASSAIVFSNATGNSFTINWTSGNGARRLVLLRQGAAVNVNPADLVSYNSNVYFGSGSQIGSGNYVVYWGTSNTVTVQGLQPNSNYHVAIFEANGNTTPVYLSLNPAVGVHSTLPRPTIAASNITFSGIDGNTLKLNWTPGNGSRRIIIARAGAPVTALPQDGVDYLATTTSSFATAPEVEPGQKVIYDNTGGNLDLTGLDHSTAYHFAVFEYDGTGSSIAYLTSTFATGSSATVSTPTVQASAIVFSNVTGNSMTVGFTPGNGARRIVIARAGSAVNVTPAMLSFYSANASLGSGAEIGTGNFVVAYTTGNSVTVTNLNINGTYHFAVFEANGFGSPVYLLSNPATGSRTTSDRPTVAASAFSFSQLDGNAMRLGWTAGNGQKRIIIARAGAPVDAVPLDGVDYLPSTISSFATAPEIAPGQKVVYDNTGTSLDLTGLSSGVTYHFRVYEYSGTGSTIAYLTTDFAAGSAGTVTAPLTSPSNIVFSSITGNAMTLSWTAGSGSRRIVVAKAGAPVDAAPQIYAYPSASSIFGNGANLGNGNIVIHNNVTNSVTVTNLSLSTSYHFAVYEANGISGLVYNLVPATGSQVTADRPTVANSALSFSQLDGNKMRLNWTTGNGEKRIVVARAGAPVDAVPVDGVDYLAGITSSFSSAPEIAPGQKVVYDNTGNAFDFTGLMPNTVYHFRVYEYSGTGGGIAYLTSSFASGTQATLAAPTVQANGVNFTSVGSTSVNVGWTNGNGNGRIVIARQGAPVNAGPVELNFYQQSVIFGNGSQIGNGNYVVYRGNANNTTVTNLQAGTTYHFSVYEYNGADAPLYLVPGVSGQVTTIGPPAVQASNAVPASIGSGSAQLQWTNGSGNRRIVLMKQGAAVDAVPQNSQPYFANSFFGSGTQIGNGNFVVFDGIQDFVTVTNLQPGTVYHFAVFEYNNFSASTQVLTTNPARAMATTAVLPVSLVSFTAREVDGVIKLDWATAWEQNSERFEIERSSNGNVFSRIGTVSAAGNSNALLQYGYRDGDAPSGTIYYRLRQVDLDGRAVYSKVVRVVKEDGELVKYLVNPVRNNLELVLRSQPVAGSMMQLFDINGRMLLQQGIQNTVVKTDLSALSPGVYILHLVSGSSKQSLRIVKQ